MADYWERTAANLQNSMSEKFAAVVAQYEGDLASLRAKASLEIEARDKIIEELKEELLRLSGGSVEDENVSKQE